MHFTSVRHSQYGKRRVAARHGDGFIHQTRFSHQQCRWAIPARPSEISDRGFRAVVDLNLHGTWNMLSRFVPDLIAGGDGSIVNVVHNQVGDRGAPLFCTLVLLVQA